MLRTATRRALLYPDVAAAGAASYPLDGISNIAAAYSVRRLLGSYSGPLVQLRRASDNAVSDFGDGLDELDTSAISAWAGGAAYIKTLYDQTEGVAGNASTLYDSYEPLFSASVAEMGGKHAWQLVDATQQLSFSLSFPAQVHAFTVAAGTGTARWRMLGGGVSPTFYIDYGSGSGAPLWYWNGSQFAFYAAGGAGRDGNPHVYDLYVPGSANGDGNNVVFRRDGGTVSKVGTVASSAPAVTSTITFGNMGNSPYQSDMIVISGALSPADHNAIGASLADYYGPTWTTVT